LRIDIAILLCFPLLSLSQDYSRFTEISKSLYHSTSEKEIDSLWKHLVDSNQVPLVVEDSVAFLYWGDAKTVAWMGDFNAWGYDANFNNKGARIPNTNL